MSSALIPARLTPTAQRQQDASRMREVNACIDELVRALARQAAREDFERQQRTQGAEQ